MADGLGCHARGKEANFRLTARFAEKHPAALSAHVPPMPDAPPDPTPHPDATVASPPTDAPATHELPYRAELRRKALHLLALALPLGVALLGKTPALWILVPATLLALTCDVLRVRSARFARLIRRVFGALMRADEWGAAEDREAVRFNGATLTLVTMALLTLFFPVPTAVTAFALFMIGDAAAALVGRRWGRTHWGDSSRTLEGSAAFVLAGGAVLALLAAVGYAEVSFWTGALAVLAAAGAEALPRPFNDNLRVPFVAALALYFLPRLLGI